jgi:carbon storage regulator
MLIIRRERGESVFIGREVEVEVLEISGSQVKLGIRAPRQIVVLRKEILLTQQANREASVSLSAGALAELAGRLRAR